MQPDTSADCGILFDARWDGPHGIARVGRELLKRLPGAQPLVGGLRLHHPLEPLWLAYKISRLAPRVYFSPGFNSPLGSPRPFVFMIHDLNYIHCHENSDPLRRLYFNALVRPACRRAARVLTVSEFSRQQILDWAGIPTEKVINIGAGVDERYCPGGPRSDPGFPYVLYVGNRLQHKNIERLMQAFAAVRPDCKLMLSGLPDPPTVAIARRLGIEPFVRFAGIVPEEHMPALYRGARCVVLPSLFEGFGLPIVEAMACGVPTLASNVTSLPEIAGGAALLVNPRSVDEIAGGLSRLLTDESLRADLVERGQLQARRFSWQSSANAVNAVLAGIH